MPKDKRQHTRTNIALALRVTFEDGTCITVKTWDISDGGLGIHLPDESDTPWSIGMKVKSKVMGLPFDSPELEMQVVRITDDKIGLKNL